jgi:hypothetical protein
MRPIHKGESNEMGEILFGRRYYCKGFVRRMNKYSKKRMVRLRRRTNTI